MIYPEDGELAILSSDGVAFLDMGGLEVVSKLVLYYLHERGWNLTSWGVLSKHGEKQAKTKETRWYVNFWMKPRSRISNS